MRHIIAVLLIPCVCVLGQPTAVAAGPQGGTSVSRSTTSTGQGQVDGWDRLPAMPRGTRVRLTLSDGAQIVGRLVSTTQDAVVLEKNEVQKGSFSPPSGTSLRDPLTFSRSEVSSALEAKGWPTWAKVLVWVCIGWAVAGAVIAIGGNPNAS